MSLKKRIIQASTGLAVAGALTVFNAQETEAASWTPNTVEDIKSVIDEQAADQDGTVEYEFRWGDTLWAISEAADISLSHLTQINDIQNADLINVGGRIYLSNDGTVISVEENNTVRSYDVSEETVVETETPEEVEAVETETSEEVAAVEAETSKATTEQAEASSSNESTSNSTSSTTQTVTESTQTETTQTQSTQETTQTTQTTSTQSTQSASETQQVSAPAAPTGGVYSIATSQLGVPYRWAGGTPAGFDCSGFVNWVFAQAGRSVPRTTGSLYAAATPVSNPQVGDLVFFGNGSVSHVGIYAGNGQFIGSQTSTGVAHASVHSGYWGARFIGYGRI